MRKKIYVENLSFETTETELKELFTQSGLVETVRPAGISSLSPDS